MIIWLIWDCPPRYLRRFTQGMRCDEIIGQASINIVEGDPDDLLHALVLT